jgi:hypothetical protein
MFRKNKWQEWWDSLSPQMQEYLNAQPVWHDQDLYKALLYGVAIGFLIGLLF